MQKELLTNALTNLAITKFSTWCLELLSKGVSMLLIQNRGHIHGCHASVFTCAVHVQGLCMLTVWIW